LTPEVLSINTIIAVFANMMVLNVMAGLSVAEMHSTGVDLA
jgi:hypothetical protein